MYHLVMLKKYLSVTLMLLAQLLTANPYSDVIYAQVADITDPTDEDYKLIQDYISNGTIPYMNRIIDWRRQHYARDFILYNGTNKIVRKFNFMNCKKKDRENCIVLYASFTGDYKKKLKQLVKEIKKSDYIGHILYYYGGWPNIEEGDLCLSHVPNAFRISSIREAKRLGFKRVLWLDCDVTPVISLNTIFDRIEQNGIFAYLMPYSLRALCPRGEHITAFNLTLEQANNSFTIHTSILGLNLEDHRALAFIAHWHYLVKNKEKTCMTAHLDHCLIANLANEHYTSDYFPPMMMYVNTEAKKNLEFLQD